MSLQGKHILLGVTGSIAAYKAAMLVRLLVKEGAEVRVVMSQAARDFITPLTLATLCKHPILIDNFDPTNGAWNSHISLGEWADHYLIAPATANTLAKMAHGVADNLLLCTYLSARCPVSVAPAMDLDMYRHPATQQNLGILRDRHGVGIVEPQEGELASGLVGKGRMAEPAEIVRYLAARFMLSEAENLPLRGKKIIVTAGATVEPIDPVRFVSNYSTGKMGYAIAEALAARGARVMLVSGHATATLGGVYDNIELFRTPSAAEMYETCARLFPEADGAVFCAAVADYTPAHPAEEKHKHHPDRPLILELKPTRDIAAEMGRIKRPGQVTLGFALETAAATDEGGGVAYAQKKLESKNLDAIVLNSLRDAGAGFGTDTNKVTIIDRDPDLPHLSLPLKSKMAVAEDIAEYIGRKFGGCRS